MAIDIFQSRRGYNEYCCWWDRKENSDNDELVMNRIPTGYFFAKEVSNETNNNNIINGTFAFERDDLTIQTPDDVFGLSVKDIVKYQGEKWIVQSVSKSKFRIQQSEYALDKHVSHIWTITLRK